MRLSPLFNTTGALGPKNMAFGEELPEGDRGVQVGRRGSGRAEGRSKVPARREPHPGGSSRWWDYLLADADLYGGALAGFVEGADFVVSGGWLPPELLGFGAGGEFVVVYEPPEFLRSAL